MALNSEFYKFALLLEMLNIFGQSVKEEIYFVFKITL